MFQLQEPFQELSLKVEGHFRQFDFLARSTRNYELGFFFEVELDGCILHLYSMHVVKNIAAVSVTCIEYCTAQS